MGYSRGDTNGTSALPLRFVETATVHYGDHLHGRRHITIDQSAVRHHPDDAA